MGGKPCFYNIAFYNKRMAGFGSSCIVLRVSAAFVPQISRISSEAVRILFTCHLSNAALNLLTLCNDFNGSTIVFGLCDALNYAASFLYDRRGVWYGR